MKLSLTLALSWLSQARGVHVQGVVADRVHTDSRSLQAGDLFVALRGERFDGNQFIAQAKAQGAVAVVCEASGEAQALSHGLPALVVPDARIALGELAAGWRGQFSLPLRPGQSEQRHWRAADPVQFARPPPHCRGRVGHEPPR
jgi:UDP-N-acetylmuramoyl-tripeptide--D-alanyl-D-alanine ligase